MSTKNNLHSVKEAAALIGITDGRLRQMIRAGSCDHEKLEDSIFPAGYVYKVPDREVKRLKKEVREGPGRPRISD